MSQPTSPFNVEITLIQRKALTELAEASGISKGAMLRQLIIFAHAHVFEGKPLCANGAQCYVPQMHQMARGQAPTPAPPPNTTQPQHDFPLGSTPAEGQT